MIVKLGDFVASEEQVKVLNEILVSGQITEGKYTKLFEQSVADYIGVKHAIAVTNGTVSLQLIGQYLTHKLGKTLNVCVPATTFPATLNAFKIIGCNIILCDVDNTLCMDIDSLSEEQREIIDVIVPVSLLGYSPNMDYINEQASKYRWIVVEDFAEAFGSSYMDKKLGSIGNFGSSSFYMSHVIQAGELGVITTNDDEAATLMRSMKNHGRTGPSQLFEHSYIGSNYKTTEFVSAIGYLNMQHADEIIAKRQQNVSTIYQLVTNTRLYKFPISYSCSYLGYPMLADTEEYKKKLCTYLNEHGIETRGMFPCLANQLAYENLHFGEGLNYPISDSMEKRGFYVGVHQYLTEEQLQYMCKGLNEEL